MLLWAFAFNSLCGHWFFFFFCLGKYLQVELPGYMHVSVCAVPPQEASEARSLLPPRQITRSTVFCFRCCDDCLLLTATSISDQPQASCSVGLPLGWPPRFDVSSNIPEPEFCPPFALNQFSPFQQGGCRYHSLPHSGRTTVPQNLGGCGRLCVAWKDRETALG